MPVPNRCIVVCATKRSGSSFFCRSLGRLALPEVNEWLLDQSIDFACKELDVPPDRPFLDRIRAAVAYKTGAEGIFATKVMANDLRTILRRLRAEDPALEARHDEEVAALFLPQVHFIHFFRTEKIAQATSLVRAIQTGKWNRETPRPDQYLDHPIFDFDALRGTLRQIERDEAYWDSFLATANAPSASVVYEDFCTKMPEALERLARFCNVALHPAAEGAAETPQLKQSNPAWIERYRAIEAEMAHNEAAGRTSQGINPAQASFKNGEILHLSHRDQVWIHSFEVESRGDRDWIAYAKRDLRGSTVILRSVEDLDSGELIEERRIFLPHDVAPGENVRLEFPAVSPARYGAYRLRLSLAVIGEELRADADRAERIELLEVIPTWIERSWNRYFPESVEQSWGWRHDPVFGWFNTLQFPWLFHQELGWIYCTGQGLGADDCWFWDWELKLLWTTRERFPEFYSFERERWLRYERHTLTPRRFQDLTSGEWIEVPRVG